MCFSFPDSQGHGDHLEAVSCFLVKLYPIKDCVANIKGGLEFCMAMTPVMVDRASLDPDA